MFRHPSKKEAALAKMGLKRVEDDTLIYNYGPDRFARVLDAYGVIDVVAGSATVERSHWFQGKRASWATLRWPNDRDQRGWR